MVTPIHKVFISLNQTLEHVQNKLLVIINKHSENASNRQEYLVPLEITDSDGRLPVLRHLDFKESKQHGAVLLSCNFHHESQGVDDFIPELISVLVIILTVIRRARYL